MNQRINPKPIASAVDTPMPADPAANGSLIFRGTSEFSGTPLVGTYKSDVSPVVSGMVAAGEADPINPECRRVAVMDLTDGKLLLGQSPVAEATFDTLSPAELISETMAQPVGELALPVSRTDKAFPYIAAAGLSRVLGGIAADDHAILTEFGMAPRDPEPAGEVSLKRGGGGLDMIKAETKFKVEYITKESTYVGLIDVAGRLETGNQSPKLQILAAAAALVFGVPCPPAKAVELELGVKLFIACVANMKNEETGLREGWKVDYEQKFSGSSNVGNELCEGANILINAAKAKQAQDAAKKN